MTKQTKLTKAEQKIIDEWADWGDKEAIAEVLISLRKKGTPEQRLLKKLKRDMFDEDMTDLEILQDELDMQMEEDDPDDAKIKMIKSMIAKL